MLKLNRLVSLIIVLISGLVFVSNVYADTLIVPTQYPTIQAAIDAAQEGDTVLVQSGDYYIDQTIEVSINIHIVSENGPGDTVLHVTENSQLSSYFFCDAAVFVLAANLTDDTLLKGFTVKADPGAPCFSGVYIQIPYLSEAGPIISNMVFLGNTYTYVSPDGTVGIYLGGSSVKVKNTIVKNFDHGIANYVSYSGGHTEIINTVATDNVLSGFVTIGNIYNTVRNCIFVNNNTSGLIPTSPNVEAPFSTPEELSITHSDVGMTNPNDVWPGDGNINADPLFFNSLTNDYILHLNSPCIDAGNPNEAYNDPEDPVNPGMALYPAQGVTRNDMGVYGGPESLDWIPALHLITIIYPENGGIIYTGVNEPIRWTTAACIGADENLKLMILQTHNNGCTEVIVNEIIPNTGSYELPTGLLDPGIPYKIDLSIGDSVKFETSQ